MNLVVATLTNLAALHLTHAGILEKLPMDASLRPLVVGISETAKPVADGPVGGLAGPAMTTAEGPALKKPAQASR